MVNEEAAYQEYINNQVESLWQGPLRGLEEWEQDMFTLRLRQHLPDILRPLNLLYGHRADFTTWLQRLLKIVAQAYADRPEDLRRLDLRRVHEPDWFQQSNMVGYVCYTDRFAGNLNGVEEKISYLEELGVTYLHLMPLLQPRPGPNDGGYAVMDYRQVNETLGSMADLETLAGKLRTHQISLCTDLVCNHTAKEHHWAQAAAQGDPVYQDYFFMYPDRTWPDRWEQTLPEVFPEFKPGNFTYYPDVGRWVWTTFNEFQWDLNYTNPAVFCEMLDNILFLANVGVEIIRLDAVAFMWKRLGTDSQNQPEAHAILQAWRALSRIAAPATLLLAEAIVPPHQLVPYLGRGEAANKECDLAYHNVFMVLLWSGLAERNARLMTYALQQLPGIPSQTAWLTYVRCHDDIGWAVNDEDAGAIGLSGYGHRSFLSDFYSGLHEASFARGATFQFNPRTNDRRISGTLASLAGLEKALERTDHLEIELSVRRILLLHNLIFAFGGIPLIYMGDELGLLNDFSYLQNPRHADDNRWMHRPEMDWDRANQRQNSQTITGLIFQGIQELIAARKRTPAFHAEADTTPVWTHNDQVFGLLRSSPRGRVLVLANLTGEAQSVPAYRLAELGFYGSLLNVLNSDIRPGNQDWRLASYEVAWIIRSSME